MCTAYTAR